MIDARTVNKIKKSSVEERLQIIEVILRSLKNEIKPKTKANEREFKPFKVRKFSFGEELHVDREELYSEKGL